MENLKNYYEHNHIYDTKTLYNKNNIELEELCRELRVNIEELQDKLLIYYDQLLENNNNN